MRNKNDLERLESSFGKLKIDHFNFDLIGKYFKKKDNVDALQVLSEKTCNDLDFNELFMFVDRTSSKVGQQYLYNRLRTIPNSSDKNDLHESLIGKFSKDKNLRINTQKLLEKLNKEGVYYITSLFQDEQLSPPKWFFIVPLLSFTSFLSLILIPFNLRMIIVLLGTVVVNFGIHYWNKKNLYNYVGSIPQLLLMSNIAKKLHANKNFQALSPNLQNDLKAINQIKVRMSFFQLESKLQGDMEAIFWSIMETIKTVFLLEPLLLFNVLKRLETKRKEIETVYEFVGQIDTLLSVASLRNGLETWCSPKVSSSGIHAKAIYHPLILNCVPNSINVDEKSILLTGSNMSGKTSFIRSIGINMITGHAINTCFAKSMTLPRIRIFSAIRISDDLMNDKSYYFEEVLTIKEMISNSSNGIRNLFLLDEIFKGTNTIERISAGKAILSLLAKKGNLVFVSTHDIELTDMLSNEYELYHFSEIVNEKNVDFDYKIKEGKLKHRNAIRILQINDYPEEVIKEAIDISKKMDNISMKLS